MKTLLFALATLLVSICTFAQGQTYVNGYYRSNGTYVQGHYRTMPNNTRNDNWSTVGNTNPYTGVAGTKAGDSYYTTPTYSNNSIYSSPAYSTYTTPSYNPSNYSTYSTPKYSTYSTSSHSTYSTPSYSTYSVPSYSTHSNYSRRRY